MAFGLLMKDNTPVDFPFRRSGRDAEESVKLGFVPGGPYYPANRAMGFVPGGPYYPGMGFVPGGPYYPANRGYGIPPAVAARVPQYNGVSIPVPLGAPPGVPTGFGRRRFQGFSWVDATGGGDDPAPVPGTTTQQDDSTWSKIGTAAGSLASSLVNAFTNNQTPGSSGAGYYCPSGYMYSAGRCVPIGSSSGLSTGLLIAGAGLAAFLLLRQRG